jgi:conjugal transfer mating pair stabilization protein TraN
MAVSQLQAHMDSAADFDPDAMQVFKGRDSRCTRDNFGLDNCCENNAALLQRCPAEMQETVRQREQGRCMQVGDYCSARTWLGVCRETTRTYCCFSSLLAKLVQVQGRQQIGREWGTATEPACGGFRPEEIAALDWSAFDLSDFYAQIQVTPPPSAADLSGSAQAAQPRCYFGAGRC